jgi:hypothetical protein
MLHMSRLPKATDKIRLIKRGDMLTGWGEERERENQQYIQLLIYPEKYHKVS